jgi:hypothetical protein
MDTDRQAVAATRTLIYIVVSDGRDLPLMTLLPNVQFLVAFAKIAKVVKTKNIDSAVLI